MKRLFQNDPEEKYVGKTEEKVSSTQQRSAANAHQKTHN
jgi:hypothetical protein